MLGLCLFEHIETNVGLAELIMTPPWRPCMVVGVMIPQWTPFSGWWTIYDSARGVFLKQGDPTIAILE
jgi:hypothetical protein